MIKPWVGVSTDHTVRGGLVSGCELLIKSVIYNGRNLDFIFSASRKRVGQLLNVKESYTIEESYTKFIFIDCKKP